MNGKQSFLNNQKTSIRISHTDAEQAAALPETIASWLPIQAHEYIILCIGTDRSTGDALGPLTGTYLHQHGLKHLHVYGTLHEPVHALNLVETLDQIYEKHHNPYIIGVDACLGKKQTVGTILTGIGSLKPGAALKKDLPAVGHMHMIGIVNVGGFMEYAVLQHTRLSLVYDIAASMANIIIDLDNQLTKRSIRRQRIIRQRNTIVEEHNRPFRKTQNFLGLLR